MSKIALVNLANLQNENTAVSAINTNNATITNAIDNTLSRNGAQPNTMQANLDMNSFQVLNLPSPATMNSPARLVDVVTNPTVTVTLPISGNNTWTGTNLFNSTSTFAGNTTFTGDAYFKSGIPWVDVRSYGCLGNSVTDDTANFQAAINAAAVRGGLVYVSNGTYYVPGGLTVPANVRIKGESKSFCTVTVKGTDQTVMTFSGGDNSMENMTITGKSHFGDSTGSFGATQPALTISSSNGYFRDLRVLGGINAILLTNASDNYFLGVETGSAYGAINLRCINSSNWFVRCKFDHNTVGVGVTSTAPYSAWAASTTYNVGDAVTVGSYGIVCTISGTTALVAPVLKNYGVDIVDGTATWQLIGPTLYLGCQLETTCLENRFIQTDFSGPYSTSFATVHNSNTMNLSDCVFSNPVLIAGCTYFIMRGCALTSAVNGIAGTTGFIDICDNWFSGAGSINMGAGVSNFIVGRNYMAGGSVSVTAGASDHYVIANNIRTTVSDSGSGVNKSITGNVA